MASSRIRRVAVVCLAVAACSGEGDAAPVVSSSVSTTTASLAEASGPPCDLLEIFDEAEEALGSPQVFELDAEGLAETLAMRRDATARFLEESDDVEDRRVLRHLVSLFDDMDAVLVDAWTSRYAELVEVGVQWVPFALEGDDELVGRYYESSSYPISGLYAECRAPELASYPVEDRVASVEDGLIVFNRPAGAGGALFTTSPEGGDVTKIRGAEGWDDVRDISVDPGGTRMAGVAFRDGYETTAIAVGSVADGFDVIYEPDEASVSCPQWSADGTRVIATVTIGGVAAGVVEIGLDGDVNGISVDLADFYCADELSDGRLVLGYATEDLSVSGGVAVVASDGAGPVSIFRLEGCGHQIGDVASDDRILLSVSCRDPLESGLYVVDVDGNAERLVSGLIAVPRWSPSGDSIVFGLLPLGFDPRTQISAWIVRSDGTGLRQVEQPPSSWTAWVAG